MSPIYTFSDARNQLKARTGHRSDVPDAEIDKYINQAQQVMATTVKGIDVFEVIVSNRTIATGQSGFVITAAQPGGLGLTDFWAFEDVLDTTDVNNRRRLRRNEWDIDLNIVKRAVGPPTLWSRRFGTLFVNTVTDKARLLSFIYRRIATPGVLEIPDEWFEHLLNLASVFLYPNIGRTKDRDVLFQRLPVPLQLGVTNPQTPSQWEAAHDTGLGVYAEV